MGRWIPLLGLFALLPALGGCAVLFPVAAVATYPLDKKATFEEAQERYTSNIRFGLYDDALPFVEPELQPRFRAALGELHEVRFSDYLVESVDLDKARTRATVVVRYRGYWLSSPFEREVRITQRWRRRLPTQNWYVTPDFDSLVTPGSAVSAPPGP